MTEAKEKDVDPPIPASVWDHPLAINLDKNLRHQADMSTLISVMWKCETDEVKKKYAKLSQIAKTEVCHNRISHCRRKSELKLFFIFRLAAAPSCQPWVQVQARPQDRHHRRHRSDVRASTRLAPQQAPDPPSRRSSVPRRSSATDVAQGAKEEGKAVEEAADVSAWVGR